MERMGRNMVSVTRGVSEVDAAVAETAVAAELDNETELPQDHIKHSTATTAADTIIITEEYINKRRSDTQRTMLVIRIIFLISSIAF